MESPRVTVVFISGFLSPKNWQSFPNKAIPDNVDVVTVNPSPTGSLHDRACQIFYELYGGTIDYGKEHSEYHKHERFGRSFTKGKLPSWSRHSPIVIIGHSLGGSTAWVLQNYLASKMFPGVDTSAEWVSGIICVSSPLNGALQVHSKGMDVRFPPIVRWASPGCVVGWIAQWCEYFDFQLIQSVMDFQHEHWNLTWRSPTAAYQLLLSIFGFCLHSGTDNIAYDVTVRSQLAWSKTLRTLPGSYYVSVVGSLSATDSKSWYGNALRWLTGGEPHTQLYGVDTSEWLQGGSDGLLSVFTQQRPHLADLHPWCAECAPQHSKHRGKHSAKNVRASVHAHVPVAAKDVLAGAHLRKGVWHCVDREMSHLTAALACVDTWTFLLQTAVRIAELHGRAPDSPRSVARRSPNAADHSPDMRDHPPRERQSSGSSHLMGCTTCSAAFPRADMQGVDLDVHAEHSSRGMAFRIQNIVAALVLFAALLCMSPAWTMRLDENRSLSGLGMYQTAAGALSLAFMIKALWQGSQPTSTAVKILPNYTHVYSDILEVALATYRVYLSQAATSSPTVGTASAIGSEALLLGTILQYLLPRALLDYGLPWQNTLAAVLVAASPSLGSAFSTVPVQVSLAVMVTLPKACWAVIYATQLGDLRKHAWSKVLRGLFVCAAVALYVACASWYLSSLYAAYCALVALTRTATAGLVVVALLPLSAFQDLSECFQYVMIERKYPASVPIEGDRINLKQF